MKTKLKKYKNIIFDFDGTLFDTNKLHEDAYKKTLKKFGYDESLIDYKKIAGISTLHVFNNLFNPDIAVQLTENKQKYYREHAYKVEPLFSILELKKISLRCNLFIVSGGSRESLNSILKYHGILNIFKDVITSDDTVQSKPDSEPYIHCLIKNKLNIKECIAIEDSMNGVLSASKAGIDVFGVHNSDIKKFVLKYYHDINEIYF